MPAEVEFSEMTFVNATSSNNEIAEKQNPRGFKSFVRYDCDTGYVAVGRSLLMCDVDESWNGPPPRCEPVYCPEPTSIRHGGMSLSTNSTAFQTVWNETFTWQLGKTNTTNDQVVKIRFNNFNIRCWPTTAHRRDTSLSEDQSSYVKLMVAGMERYQDVGQRIEKTP